MIVNIFVAALISFCSATFLLFLFLKPNFAFGIPKIVYNQKKKNYENKIFNNDIVYSWTND